MSHRGRAAAFGVLAVTFATVAAMVANRYGSSVARGFGPMRPVVIARSDLKEGYLIGPADLRGALERRRVPETFVPPGALARPADALGRMTAVALPAGAYVLASQLDVPRPKRGKPRPGLGAGLRPVQLAVSGGEALFAGGARPEGSRVDVVVTTESRAGGSGRTYIAAAGVRLLSLTRRGPSGPGPVPTWSATLALTRGQALRLIVAESFARSVRLLPVPGAGP
jgi:Flp pilus assembly protein CpaB